ncbi:DIS3-like exonuclease 2 [Epargyreus clarus]|uniref:DIS3-like exonuclease 2 n=1 Tax=Epargyreus clarus TaxID=520877 RepID=UPI003C2EC540
MADICDTTAGKVKVEDASPSTSQVILSQLFQAKNCIIEADRNKTFPPCNNISQASNSKEKHHKDVTPTSISHSSANGSARNAMIQPQNTNRTQENDNDDSERESCLSPKKKNARKRENRKLQLQMPANEQNSVPAQAKNMQQAAPQTVDYTAAILRNERPPVQEFFMKFITPMYAPTNARYLENLKHHPNYKFENAPNHHHSGSVPNSPSVSAPQFQSMSYPNSPVVNEPNSPRFLQNAMQHPLLSQSLSPAAHIFHQPQFHLMRNYWVPYPNQPPVHNQGQGQFRQNRRPRPKKPETPIVFEPYISLEEVETGLKNNTLFEGVIRINPKQYQHAYISNTDRSEQDVFIDGIKNRNRALEGDVVVVQLIIDTETQQQNEGNNELKSKKGKVVFIKEKVHRRTCIGTLRLMPDSNRQVAVFVPRDNRIPRLNIPFTSWPNNFYNEANKYENVLFLALIEDWIATRFANGKILTQIGVSGDMEVERRAILAETDLDVTPFGREYSHLYPRLDYVIPEEEIKKREDCRKMCIFSIDPFNCRDIDDAVSCKKLENGNYEVGVHISDVTFFLTENTKLDEKVADKATTIYLVDKAYHMLPDELCMLCSLFPGVDKLAFSVFWEMTENAKIVSHRFSKTVINSCCQLAYEHAQAVLDEKPDAEKSFPEFYNGFTFKEVSETIKVLGKLSSIMRKARFDTGALRIDQPKLQFSLRPTDGLPESYEIYESKESHQLIEEFMLLANMAVAGRIITDYPNLAFLRCHPPPSGYMLRQLAAALKPIGIDLDVSSAGDLYRSILPHVDPQTADQGKAMVLSMLCAKPMSRAKYFCAGDLENEDLHHYALNVPLYTHFTSPIRRYADIMVHRLLSASLNFREVPRWELDYVKQVAAQCNKQKFNAKKAGELSTELYILKYIELRLPMVIEAAVVEVREKYIDVIIVAMGLNRRMFFSPDFPGKYERIKSEAGSRLAKMEVTWFANNNKPILKQVIEVFSIVKVEMYRDEMGKVNMRLIRPE